MTLGGHGHVMRFARPLQPLLDPFPGEALLVAYGQQSRRANARRSQRMTCVRVVPRMGGGLRARALAGAAVAGVRVGGWPRPGPADSSRGQSEPYPYEIPKRCSTYFVR